jgi:hypothetical protein
MDLSFSVRFSQEKERIHCAKALSSRTSDRVVVVDIVPDAVKAVAVVVAGLRVADVRVKRVTVIGELLRTVLTGDLREGRLDRAGCRNRRPTPSGSYV